MDTNAWANRYDLLANPIHFVSAGKDWRNHKAKCPRRIFDQLSGEQAKKIYEDVINEKSEDNVDINETVQQNSTPCRVRKYIKEKRKGTIIPKTFYETDLFRAAQGGDLELVKNCIRNSKLNINSKDGYCWTSLMMAAYEGHHDIVLFLLSKGAEWTQQIDGSGYDARDLACLGGHQDIAEILMNSEKHILKFKVSECEARALRTIKREKMWCEICKCHYYAPVEKASRDPHLSSTLHLISDKDSLQPCHSHFYISGTNRGYRLLRKDGWDGESGLGPGGAGKKYPVKTIFKRDRLGLGADGGKTKARVTHFGAHDCRAVKRRNEVSSTTREWNSKTARKRHSVDKAEEAKQKEMDFRRLFH